MAPPAHPKVTWSFRWLPGSRPHLQKKSCIVWEENSHKWYTRSLPVIDTILRFGLGQERIFAHQRTTFSVSLFRTDDNDRLNGVVKEKVLVAGLLGVP